MDEFVCNTEHGVSSTNDTDNKFKSILNQTPIKNNKNSFFIDSSNTDKKENKFSRSKTFLSNTDGENNENNEVFHVQTEPDTDSCFFVPSKVDLSFWEKILHNQM